MCGHSLQAQPLSGGAGMNVLSRRLLLHLVDDPGLGHDDELLFGLAKTCVEERLGRADEVARAAGRLSSHSGWATTSASGCSSSSCTSRFSLKISCTMQLPGQRIISRPVCFAT